MKKIKLSIAGLLLAGMSYGQCTTIEDKECCVRTIMAVYEHEGMTVQSSWCKDSVMISYYELNSIIGDLEDILEWQQQDMENGETSQGSYEEGWGSNYWLTLMREELYIALQSARLK